MKCCQDVFHFSNEDSFNFCIPTNVRSYCEPALPTNQIGPFFSSESFSYVPGTADIWERSAHINHLLHENVEKGNHGNHYKKITKYND